jgi:hypothetical protein
VGFFVHFGSRAFCSVAPGENVPAIRAAGNLLVIELEISFLQIF